MRFNARLPAKAANPPKCLPAVREPYGYVQHRFNDTRNAELGGTDGQVRRAGKSESAKRAYMVSELSVPSTFISSLTM